MPKTLLTDFNSERSIFLKGEVDDNTSSQVMLEATRLHSIDPGALITMFVSSGGGNVGDAFALYDYMMKVLKPNLQTVILGEASSSAVILFLMGKKRYVGEMALLKLHEFSFTPDRVSSITARRARKIARSLETPQAKYTTVVAQRSGMTESKVRTLMRKEATILPVQAVELGLAHQIL